VLRGKGRGLEERREKEGKTERRMARIEERGRIVNLHSQNHYGLHLLQGWKGWDSKER
jgi:hypothetical protein